jgi:hypothetical protein
MDAEVVMGEPEDSSNDDDNLTDTLDPDEFFAKHAFRIVYQTNNFFLPQIKDLIEKGDVLNLRPEYQRRLRWTKNQKSKLIESLLLNIPIPPVFLYENDAARYEVMDGQQRLNAVKEYLAGDFALSSLTVLHPLNGIRYSKCPPRIRRALERSSLSAIVLLLESKVDSGPTGLSMTDIRRFIFDRLNTGGTKLNPQEIRNALNPGDFNDLIIEITRDKVFTEVFDIPQYTETNPNDYYESPLRQKNILYSTMGDCQLVLRYFALKEDTNVRGSMKSILDRAMQRKVNNIEAESLKVEYLDRLYFLYQLFEHKPFRLPPDEKGHERISASIYDGSMVATDQLWGFHDEIREDQDNVRVRMQSAMNDSKQLGVLTGQGNSANAIRERISLIKSILKQG